MRKTLLIFCLFVGLNTVAQNRLEFNQVVTIDTNYNPYQAYGNFTYYDSYYYVPAGKAWKIEASASNGYLEINDVDMQHRYYAGSGSYQSVAINNLYPIWLKSGDKIRYRFNGSCGTSGCWPTIRHFTSILEFNVVPQ
ncbi:MAG: hypothetical protein VX762_04930 [Bacteroidota bacterium]|nr:hypothetical protein [Bacteroidota bacterium]